MFCLSEYWIFQGQFNSPTTSLGGSGKRFFIIDSLLDQIHWYYVLSLPIFPGGMTIVPQNHTNVWFNKTNSTPKLIYLHKNYANLHLFHSKLLFMLNGYSRPDLLKWHWLFAYRWRNYSPFFHKMTTYEIYITTTRILNLIFVSIIFAFSKPSLNSTWR